MCGDCVVKYLVTKVVIVVIIFTPEKSQEDSFRVFVIECVLWRQYTILGTAMVFVLESS